MCMFVCERVWLVVTRTRCGCGFFSLHSDQGSRISFSDGRLSILYFSVELLMVWPLRYSGSPV